MWLVYTWSYLPLFGHEMADVELGEKLPHIALVVMETCPGNLWTNQISESICQPDCLTPTFLEDERRSSSIDYSHCVVEGLLATE